MHVQHNVLKPQETLAFIAPTHAQILPAFVFRFDSIRISPSGTFSAQRESKGRRRALGKGLLRFDVTPHTFSYPGNGGAPLEKTIVETDMRFGLLTM